MTIQAREVELVWHDLTPRLLEVIRVERLTPGMARVTLGGEELDGFKYGAPDDHVKVFFPEAGAELPVMPTLGEEGLEPPPPGSPLPIYRDYTIRYLRPEVRELDIDFVLHEHGPGGSWAATAKPGQRVGILGPRGSNLVPYTFDWYLLGADETALPALAAWLEQLPAGATVLAFAEVANEQEKHALDNVRWLYRDRGQTLGAAIEQLSLPGGDGYVWIAGEATGLKPIRRELRGRGLNRKWMEIDGYWKRGVENLDHHEDDGE
ncbi:siderophore-interacting protein [Paractinoplanes atraurantiacus]|uniref:NADPH-dependent ferric siderophore reductase, contains FAD-binding and SIP domains n=1 Tax=Paractinoplanes atraurantiacus TaxID=1036182 RepID=A0A285KLB2_9ACTN|nr:siderophore-interacting protein [Actinoplanes atraurantiacus]SNY73003.1 NADPH-dependent ferric siderophore reductase, contains FAD-binding and SIP domains [Actinoplanes atraurantiacus]